MQYNKIKIMDVIVERQIERKKLNGLSVRGRLKGDAILFGKCNAQLLWNQTDAFLYTSQYILSIYRNRGLVGNVRNVFIFAIF